MQFLNCGVVFGISVGYGVFVAPVVYKDIIIALFVPIVMVF